MGLHPKYSAVILNLLVAVAISLVVNFSYLLLYLVDQRELGKPQPGKVRIVERRETGRLSVSPDGHGYLIYENGDSVYVPQTRVRRLGLENGDSIVADLSVRGRAGGHPLMADVRYRNGVEFDFTSVFNRPSRSVEMLLQLLYYLVVSFILLSILTSSPPHYTSRGFVKRSLWCLVAAVLLYLIAPVTQWHTGRDYLLLLKCSFAVAVSVLYGRIYVLISQRQAVVLENERLKNENLTTRYNMLVGQINPHFFFNSLNSLAMLVRERDGEKALTYIDQLSYTFRYIIQNGQSTLVPLSEELRFAEAYGYLFKIRYADKLFFDVDVDDEYRSWLLPALSLQPLIGNAVKHNAITRSRPFHISIRTEGSVLVVSNPRIPKLEREPSTGIGLRNLRSRWMLITGSDVEIIETEAEFTVRLPLRKNEKQA